MVGQELILTYIIHSMSGNKLAGTLQINYTYTVHSVFNKFYVVWLTVVCCVSDSCWRREDLI